MCERCIQRDKNFRRQRKHKVRFGFIKVLAHQFFKGHSVPLFRNRADNYAVEAHLTRIEKACTNKKPYRRSKRDWGNDY